MGTGVTQSYIFCDRRTPQNLAIIKCTLISATWDMHSAHLSTSSLPSLLATAPAPMWQQHCVNSLTHLWAKNTLATFHINAPDTWGSKSAYSKNNNKKKVRKTIHRTCQLNCISIFSFIRQANYLKPPHPCHSHSPCTGTSSLKIRLFQPCLI